MLVPDSTNGEHGSLKNSLEELLKLMLIVWCKENNAIKTVSGKANEHNEAITIKRKSGEYGFRMHGSRPVIISAIEADTPAENSGLEVGDIIVSINKLNVLDKSHAEVVEIARINPNIISLEVAHTNDVLNPVQKDVYKNSPLYNGYLWKLGGYASGIPSTKWVRRWFVLKSDNCLYCYKTDTDKQPVGAVLLFNYKIEQNVDSTSRPYSFNLIRENVPTMHLAADSDSAVTRWMEVLNNTIQQLGTEDLCLEEVKRNLRVSPNTLKRPDCFGYLEKLDKQQKYWKRLYCVLKDAYLYFYKDVNSENAFNMACLHGYAVKMLNGNITDKKYGFEMIPSNSKQKYFYFCTESDADQKRWITAVSNAIERWICVE